MMTESTFVRGALDKLHVKPNYAKIGDYKTAVNFYTEKKYTAAQKEMDASLMQSTMEQYVAARGRGAQIHTAAIYASLLQGGPYASDDAVDAQARGQDGLLGRYRGSLRRQAEGLEPHRAGRLREDAGESRLGDDCCGTRDRRNRSGQLGLEPDIGICDGRGRRGERFARGGGR